jgi:hypothetical protein
VLVQKFFFAALGETYTDVHKRSTVMLPDFFAQILLP